MHFHAKFKFLCIFIPFLSIFLMSHNTFAATANVTSANVDFWSSSSQSGQVQATVSLPWSANIGGSSSNRQSFYLNNISMTYPISASASDLNVFGRLVMRFEPAFTSNEDAYFCNIHLNDISSSVTAVQTSCNATVTYNYSDNTTYSVTLPIFINYTLPSGALAAYVDYNQSLPNVALSNITAVFAKTGNYDIYSITNGYSLVLTTLVSDASYYITDNGGNVDISPLVNQNQTIINQNQQIIDNQNQNTEDIINNQNQNTEDIIKSNQNCHQSDNLFDGQLELGIYNGNTGQPSPNSGYVRSSNYIPVEAYTNYTFSSPDYNGPWYIYEYTSNYSYNLTANVYSANGSFQTTLGTSYITFRTAAYTNTNARIMLVEGLTPQPYEPYGEEICKNINEQYYDEQRQADDNIANQSTSDISGSENQATTNLIGVLSNFFTQLQSFQATNCNLALPFPQFIGGTQTVNICQGKDVLGNFITVIGTLAMVTFYIPLAWVLLKMIYNEIRSFTNG